MPDTLQLESVVVEAPHLPSGLMMGRNGRVVLDGEQIKRGFRVLGEADALKQIVMVPGFSTSGDYGSGVSIDGAHFSQSATVLDGATVFFPYHFGGLFSTFNSAATARLDSRRTNYRADSPLRLAGAMYASTPDSLVTALHGEASLGLIAASGAIAVPASDNVTIRGALRHSFIDLLYTPLLSSSDVDLRYGFTDANLSMVWNLNEANRLVAKGFCNFDHINLNDKNYGLDAHMKWNNAVASLSFQHTADSWSLVQTAGYSGFEGNVEMILPQLVCKVPSYIRQFLVQTSLRLATLQLDLDWRNEFNDIVPQYARGSGVVAFDNHYRHIFAGMSAISAHRMFRLSRNILIEASAKFAFIKGDKKTFMTADPSVGLSYINGSSIWTAEVFTSSQDLHLVGFSDIGLSTDFWLPSSNVLPPQRAYGTALNYSGSILFFSPTVRVFYKRIRHMAEYNGNMISLLADDYSPMDMALSLDGFNTGMDALLAFHAGAFSGWAGYSLSYCRLRYPQAGYRLLPSSSEPLNQLKLLLSWNVSDKWSFSAYFCLASGRPYTAIKNVYLLAGNVMADYGAPNSARLPAYHRLDLTATWTLGHRSFLNFSIINAYGHRNVEMQYFKYYPETSSIGLKYTYSLYRFMPSVSYTLQF